MKQFLTCISLLCAGAALAAPLSPEEAFLRLQDEAKLMTVSGVNTRSVSFVKPAFIMKAADGLPSLYVFDNGEDNGFMVVSADDMATPLLGYSDSGSIDPDNLPPSLEYWLGEYNRQIEYARTSGVSTRSENTRAIELPNWNAVAPKVKTQWNQDSPYNEFCPLDGNVHSFTGCVATSMAQVMNYFQYPAKGQGSIKYDCRSLGITLELNFANITFDWANMINNYKGGYTPAQGSAVATLMQACGYAVQMSYSAQPQGSGAVSGNIGGAMVNYFNYDKGVRYYSRDMFTYTEWAKMLYDNINTIGPVIYDGTGAGGGHSFVFDGYQNGYFHVNWGWGGLSDGYYALDALSPAALGLGGGLGGYDYDQGCVFGLQPAKSGSQPQNDVLLYGNFQGSYSGGNLTLRPVYTKKPGYGYQGIEQVSLLVGVGYVNADTPNATPSYIANTSNSVGNLTGGLYIPASADLKIDPAKMNLTDGVKYKIICAYRLNNSDWAQMPAAIGFNNYFYLTKNGSRYTVENVPPMEYSASGVSVDTELYYNSAVKVSATLSNPNNTELTRSVAFALVNTSKKVAFIGDTFMLTLPAGGTVSQTWATDLTKQDGQNAVILDTEFYPALYDEQTETIFYTSDKTVTMHRSQGNAQISVNAVVDNAELLETEYQGTLYAVENAANFNVTTTLTVNNGYFTNELYLGIFSRVSGNNLTLVSTYPISDGFLFLEAGTTYNKTINVNFQNGVVGETYWFGVLNGNLGLAAGGNTISDAILVNGIGDAGGVESIKTEYNDGIIRVFNLQGVKVLETKDPSDVQSLGKGLYIINGKKVIL